MGSSRSDESDAVERSNQLLNEQIKQNNLQLEMKAKGLEQQRFALIKANSEGGFG